MNAPEIVHIGVPKSGTTTIQKVLSIDPRINLIKKSRYFNTNDFWKSSYYQFFKEGMLNIESDEGIVKKDKQFSGLSTALKRMKEAGVQHVILSVREQTDLLKSSYKYGISRGAKTGSFDQFLDSYRGVDFLSFLDYESVYDQINTYFDAPNISVLVYEELRNNYLDFFRKLYSTIDLEPPSEIPVEHVNRSMSKAYLNKLRVASKMRILGADSRMGKFEFQIYKKLAHLFPSVGDLHIDFPPQFAKIEEYLRESNKAFSAKIDLDLSQFGYFQR